MRSASMLGAWRRSPKRCNTTPSLPGSLLGSHLMNYRDSLKKEGQQPAVAGDTEGRAESAEEAKGLKTFCLTFFGAKIQDTKFEL